MSATALLTEKFKLTALQKNGLKKLNLITIEDFLRYFPIRYSTIREQHLIKELNQGEFATIFGVIKNLKSKKSFKGKIPMGEAILEDQTGKIKVVWFHQVFLVKTIKEGSLVRLSGKISNDKNGLCMINPEIETLPYLPIDTNNSLFQGNTIHQTIYPIYKETKGITSKFIFHATKKIFIEKIHENIEDPIPKDILEKYKLPKISTAFIWIHNPRNENQVNAARKRFAFEEVFLIQLAKQKEKFKLSQIESEKIKVDKKELNNFIKRFPFEMTKSQKKAIETITEDFLKNSPMSRLLEGDVGSGKTAVAASVAYSVVTSSPNNKNFGNLQVAYMAPTEILATQHFESFISFFQHMPIQIGLITSSGCKKFPSKTNAKNWTNISKNQLLKWVENGEIQILIGTHSLIQKTVKFKHLSLVIIDEQHRFGTRQRAALARWKDTEPIQTNVEKKTDPLVYRDLTYRIKSALFNVKKTLGCGHKEIIYQRAAAEELTKAKIKFKKEVKIPIKYNRKQIGIYQPDFVIEDKIILELKTLLIIGTTEKKQILNYLKGSDYKLAILANFGPQELTINKIIYEKARTNSVSDIRSSTSIPHLLSMTATPIPRTLALTIYGDLDLSILDEQPKGRLPVITEIVKPDKRENVYEKIKEELKNGRQAYVICPRIDDPDEQKENALILKSVTSEAVKLSKIFKDKKIKILHSKLTREKKENVMKEFAEGKIDILVATSVVEVGVNVPNATVIIIEGAERFGLAQLHQLRGRVQRSSYQPYCYLLTDSGSEKTAERLKAITAAKNGFELAEMDLILRGAGELGGGKQWGITDIGMEAIKNLKMVEAARNEAKKLIEIDPKLKNYPILNNKIQKKEKELYFE